MRNTFKFVLGSLLTLAAPVWARGTITCGQIHGVVGVIKHDHALIRDEALREKLLNDHAFANSLREGFPEALDPGRTLLLASEIERVRHEISGDLVAPVFARGDCGAFAQAYQIYRDAVARSLRLIPARGGVHDPLKEEIIAAAKRSGAEKTKATEWPTTEAALVHRAKDLLIAGTRTLAPQLGKAGQPSFGEAFDVTRLGFDHARTKPLTAEDVPRVMTSVIISHLDPHTQFLPDEEFYAYVDSMKEFAGLGVELAPGYGGVFVHSILPNGAAARSGELKVGDKIVKVDGKSIADLDLVDITKLLKGQLNTPVGLEVLRDGVHDPVQVRITRGRVGAVETTRREIVHRPGGDFGYVRFAQFTYEGARALGQAIEELARANVKGLVLDLRGNPGGVLDEAVAIQSQFERRPPGAAVYYVGNDQPGAIALKFKTDGPKFDMPLIILINEGSASAAEIVSGGLQAYGRALVVGNGPSFGKGSVQQLFPLLNYAQMHPEYMIDLIHGRAPTGGMALTAGFYFLPDGTSIQNKGVEPDVALFPERLPSTPFSEKSLYEHSLPTPHALGGRLIPTSEVETLRRYRNELAPAREALRKAFAKKKGDLLKANPDDPEKAAALFLIEEFATRAPVGV